MDIEEPDVVPDEQAPPAQEPPARSRRRGAPTALLLAVAAVIGISGGTAVGYRIQADRAPAPLPALNQPGLAYLRFNSAGLAERFTVQDIGAGLSPDVALTTAQDEPYGAEHTRQAYVQAGDTVAVIIQSRKGSAAAVPFHQAVVLQNQLLG